MSEIKFIKLNNVYGRIVTDDIGLLEALFRRFAVRVQNYFYMPQYRAGVWDGKIHFVEKSGKFYLGHFNMIYNYVKSESKNIIVDPSFKPDITDQELFKEEFNKSIVERINPEMIPRHYQLRGALKALYWKRGVIEHATGSGKSLTITLVCNYLLWKQPTHKILLLVPSVSLVDQMKDDMMSYGIPGDVIGRFYQFQKEIDCPIVVSTWQSMMNHKDLLGQFTVLLVDECHGLKADEIKAVATKALNAEYRLGFTATLPDDKAERMLVEGVTGRVLDQVLPKQLIEEKAISDLNINLIRLNYPQNIVSKLKEDGYVAEKDFIVNDLSRNKAIVNIAKMHADSGQNVLILVRRIEHGETLQKMLKEKGFDSPFIYGATSPEERQLLRKSLEKSGGNVTVASDGVFAVGVSINRLHVVIFAAAGKSKIRTLQAVGRGLRLHNTKTKLQLYDISENLESSKDHANTRKRYYKKNEFPLKEKEINIDVQEIPK
jgi:superfamily II DNA or RNA helicase